MTGWKTDGEGWGLVVEGGMGWKTDGEDWGEIEVKRGFLSRLLSIRIPFPPSHADLLFRLLLFAVLLIGIPSIALPQSSLPPDPTLLLGRAPWPGMTAWDVVWCRELVWEAQLVEVREPGQKPRLVKVTDARGWLKPNGFYGLKLNGEPIDEGLVWLSYAGTMTNLRVLFTYGSDPVRDVSPFRD